MKTSQLWAQKPRNNHNNNNIIPHNSTPQPCNSAPISPQDRVKTTTTVAITLVTTAEAAVSLSPMAITTEVAVVEEVEEITDLAEEAEVEEEEVPITDRWMIVRKTMVVRVCSIRSIDYRGTSIRYQDVGVGFQSMVCTILHGSKGRRSMGTIDIWWCYGVFLMVA
jgi:hypothetical protein